LILEVGLFFQCTSCQLPLSRSVCQLRFQVQSSLLARF